MVEFGRTPTIFSFAVLGNRPFHFSEQKLAHPSDWARAVHGDYHRHRSILPVFWLGASPDVLRVLPRYLVPKPHARLRGRSLFRNNGLQVTPTTTKPPSRVVF